MRKKKQKDKRSRRKIKLIALEEIESEGKGEGKGGWGWEKKRGRKKGNKRSEDQRRLLLKYHTFILLLSLCLDALLFFPFSPTIPSQRLPSYSCQSNEACIACRLSQDTF